ncbi:GtrA family protein [Aliiroseovarius crassostreae]|uniref:GtrA family protein n=1 Tax=Aliiroseovarius crassostreae TaxID=154981 RepID=UPI0021FFE5D5|nr:GtrA family protein [Aliiroseovarius crassostreae]UWQ03851.1 GtrA family protein [Aliiroseovarius crassostreae]
MRSRLVPFVLVGGVGTATHFLTALLLANLTTLSGILSNFGGFSAAVLISYFGHARLTFRTELDHQFHFPRFVIAAGCGLILSTALTWITYDQLGRPFWQAMALVAVTVPVLTYLLLAGWVFVQKTHRGQDLWIGGLISALCGGAVLWLFWGELLSHDVIWYLFATERWLDGEALFTDLVEINPPLNFYYTVPAIWLSQASGLLPESAQYVVFAWVYTLVLLVSWWVIGAKQTLTLPRRIVFQLLVAVALIVPAYGNLIQRDHLFLVLVTPWVLALLPPKEPDNSAKIYFLSALAALGICLKPHFLVLPILVTLVALIRDRDWRCIFSPSNRVMFVIGVLYVLFVALVHPAYFSKIVPHARYTYDSFSTGSGVVIGRVLIVALVGLIGFAAARIGNKTSSAPMILLVVTLAGLSSYLLQWTGFRYQMIPFVGFLMLGFSWFIVDPGMRRFPVGIVVIVLVILVQTNLLRGKYANPTAVALAEWITGAKSVNVLTSFVSFGPVTAHLAKAQWASSYSTIWQVPGAVNKLEKTDCSIEWEACAALQEILVQTRDDVIDDLMAFRPDALIVDKNSGYFDTPNFDWMAFFATNPAFDQIMTGYRLEAVSDRFDIWRLK